MRLMTSNFNQPQFMAHTYKIRPKSYEVEVRTDNEPYLGEEPYLVPLSKHCYFDNIKMDKENGVYSAKILEDKIIKYHIDKDIYQPHVFSYDKATGELSYNSIQMMDEGVTFNEDGEIIDIDPIEEDLSDNEKIMEQIKKVAKNALVVEKEFGAPQDIEGGLKDDDIYFWQTRNIVR